MKMNSSMFQKEKVWDGVKSKDPVNIDHAYFKLYAAIN